MATAAQIEANRRNAGKSTGPRTAEGKAKTRMNAVSHGAWVTTLERPEVAERREALREQLVEEWRPGSTVEIAIVNQMADTLLKLEQSPEVIGSAMERSRRRMNVPEYVSDAQLLAVELPSDRSKLDMLERRQRNLSRQLSRLIRDLRQLQQDRAAADESADAAEETQGANERNAVDDAQIKNEKTNPIPLEVRDIPVVVPLATMPAWPLTDYPGIAATVVGTGNVLSAECVGSALAEQAY